VGGRFLSILCGLAAAWLAAGSTGLLGHSLRHALTLLCLGGALVVGWPTGTLRGSWRTLGVLIGAVAGAGALAGSSLPAVSVMAPALVLAALAGVRPATERDPFLVASASVVALAFYRFAVTSLPWLWLAMDGLGAWLAGAAGFLSRQPLRTGATFAGLDYLVLMGALYAFWWTWTPDAGGKRRLRFVAAILGAHLLYLVVLSFAPRVLALLPATPTPPTFGQRIPWDAAQAARSLLPWNLPALAAALHLVVAWRLLKSLGAAPPKAPPTGGPWLRRAMPAGLILLAAVLPPLASLQFGRLSLADKKIVLYEKGFLNWLRPKHGEYGRLSVGMYGMLPQFVQSYGARCAVSPDLAEADLADADLVVLIFPNKPWADGQLDRIWRFVREGGSLLVLGEHTVREKEGGARFNDVLEPTALRVGFDSAMFEVGGWLESYEALHHPATAGLGDRRNEFGVVIGASVEARWPARPVLAGRFGFSDPGDPANDESKGGSMMGNHRYDAGEKLGDQLLAAEQRMGRGRVMVFGDTSGFSNSILFGSHDFVARLFATLCGDNPPGVSRAVLAAVGWALLLFCLRGSLRPGPLAAVSLVFAISLGGTTAWNHRRAAVLPDGRSSTPNRLAYIDTSHLDRASLESWREDGLGGLQMTLMRDGYLVLGLHEFTPERLQRAGLFFTAAPARRYTARETEAVREFIEGGGIFICTAGWPEASGSRELLADLGFYVGGIGAATSGQPEPRPFGHFKAPYYNGGDYMAYVRFHAAWPVESTDPQARPIAYGPRDPKGPPDQPDPTVILMRRLGRGKAVVVADTLFAANVNLEREGGQPFEGMRENADFWRWFLTYLNDQPLWTPPKPTPPAPPGKEGSPAP
jgi:hypothetical protein